MLRGGEGEGEGGERKEKAEGRGGEGKRGEGGEREGRGRGERGGGRGERGEGRARGEAELSFKTYYIPLLHPHPYNMSYSFALGCSLVLSSLAAATIPFIVIPKLQCQKQKKGERKGGRRARG